MNTSKWRPTVPQAVGALGALLASNGDLTIPALTAVAIKVTEAIRFLSADQRDVVEFILEERKGEAYRTGIEESALRRSYAQAPIDLDAILAQLEKSDVLVRENGRVRLKY